MLKTCNKCKREQPVENFPTTRTRGRDDSKGSLRPRSYCKACQSARHRLTKYGLTADQYKAMAEAQGYLCLLCELPENALGGLVVDHDHNTGKVRGLLCHPCNRRLGVFEENYDKFTAYIARGNAYEDGSDRVSPEHVQSTERGGYHRT